MKRLYSLIGGEIGGDVPSTASEIGGKDVPPRQSAQSRGRAAHHDVLLMAMHDVCAENLRKHRGRQRVVCLSPDVPRTWDNAHVELIDVPLLRLGSECQQSRGRAGRHVARQLQRVALRTAHDARGSEERRHEVKDARASAVDHLRASSSIDRNQAGNIHAQRRSYAAGFRLARRCTSLFARLG